MFRTMKLEDGEQVTMLRGSRKRPKDGAQRSNQPHAGTWGPGRGYILVPCKTSRQVNLRAASALRHAPGLENRSGDLEVLFLGPQSVIDDLVARGPLWCRAMTRRSGGPGRPENFQRSEPEA